MEGYISLLNLTSFDQVGRSDNHQYSGMFAIIIYFYPKLPTFTRGKLYYTTLAYVVRSL